MFDFLALFIGFFLFCLLVRIIFVGVKFVYSLITYGHSNNSYYKEIDKQSREDSIEDSQADGLMLVDDPLFPEEPDED